MYYIYVTLMSMDENSCVIYNGSKFTIKWYYDKAGKSVVFNFFENSKEEL